MHANMGTPDRVIRGAIIAPALIILALLIGATEAVGIVLLVLAAVMLLTSAVGTCPLYAPFGVSTCRRPGSA